MVDKSANNIKKLSEDAQKEREKSKEKITNRKVNTEPKTIKYIIIKMS